MKVKVLAKSSCCLHSMLGAYAYTWAAQGGGTHSSASKFKKSIKTLAQADCMAFVNALALLSLTKGADQITDLEIITDSGVVVDLLQTYKAQKHCTELAGHWREKVKPLFTSLKEIKYTKVGKEILAGDNNKFTLINLEAKAKNELERLKEITN